MLHYQPKLNNQPFSFLQNANVHARCKGFYLPLQLNNQPFSFLQNGNVHARCKGFSFLYNTISLFLSFRIKLNFLVGGGDNRKVPHPFTNFFLSNMYSM